MACLDMYNSSPHSQSPPPPLPPPLSMSPRISFSNDFVVESQTSKNLQTLNSSTNTMPASTDFEFSISNNDMISDADEIFFKGRLLPFKPSNTHMTLRDQLLLLDHQHQHQHQHQDDLIHGDNALHFSLNPSNEDSSPSSNNNNKWKGFLGLRKPQIIGSKKPDKTDGFAFVNHNAGLAKTPTDVISTGNPSNTDMEVGI